ncbi:MAG: hypothetical protein B7Z37_20950 [Verrucomicrobia bacterium 12-59-8]|nr:MAG: hypothetical protein B7Z37_20950 [Verrucomicrobia bacterium 12-59-8]
MKDSEKITEVRFRCKLGDHDVEGVVINPGSYFGKVWLFQIGIANALNPFFAIEANSEQDAIDEFADNDRFSHLIDVAEEDCPKWIPNPDSDDDGDYEPHDYAQAGNDSHFVDLTSCHIQKGPDDLRYFVEWNPQQDSLSSVIDSELNDVRDELKDS